MPAVSGLGHVGIHVNDLMGQRDFYSRVMGLKIADEDLENRGMVFFSSDPVAEHHEFVIVQGRTAPEDAVLINQISFKADTLAELKEFYDVFRAEKVRIDRTVSHGNAFGILHRRRLFDGVIDRPIGGSNDPGLDRVTLFMRPRLSGVVGHILVQPEVDIAVLVGQGNVRPVAFDMDQVDQRKGVVVSRRNDDRVGKKPGKDVHAMVVCIPVVPVVVVFPVGHERSRHDTARYGIRHRTECPSTESTAHGSQ